MLEAPRGGAGIEIVVALYTDTDVWEAPRGGAGIEMKFGEVYFRAMGSPSWRGWY